MASYNKGRPSFIMPYRGGNRNRTQGSKSSKNSPKKLFGVDKIEQGKKELAKGANRSTALDAASKLLTAVGTPTEVMAAKVVLGVIENTIESLANNSAKMLPYFYHNSSLDIDNTKVHIVRFNVGRKSTSSVLTAESVHGLTKLQLSNSLSECQDINTRKMLTRSFGFNQKSIDFLASRFYCAVSDYNSIYNIGNYRQPAYGGRVPYGFVKEEYSNVRIRNSNTYHRLKFKIHVIKILDDDVTLGSLYAKTTNRSAASQDTGALPKIYQISNRAGVNENAYVASVLCHYGVSLKRSSNFLSQANIVKTFTKMLNPGDTFDFRMTHHMGPGIRLDIAQTYMKAGGKGDQPSGYGLIVEAEGTMCQGMRLKDKAIFQGNCPGWYNYEFTKGISLVRHEGASYYVKYYDRQILSKPPITFNANVIGRPGEDGKEFTVLSTSKQHVVFGSNISDNIGNKSTSKDNIVEFEGDFDVYNENEDLEND